MTDRKTRYVGLRLSPELYEAAKARAAAQSKTTGLRVTVSDVLRQALTAMIRARANDPSREPPQWSGGE